MRLQKYAARVRRGKSSESVSSFVDDDGSRAHIRTGTSTGGSPLEEWALEPTGVPTWG